MVINHVVNWMILQATDSSYQTDLSHLHESTVAGFGSQQHFLMDTNSLQSTVTKKIPPENSHRIPESLNVWVYSLYYILVPTFTIYTNQM